MSYEVRCLADKRWLTESVFQDEAEALAFARSRLKIGRVEAVRVVEEKTGIGGFTRERVVFEQAGTTRDRKGAGAVADDAVSLCDNVIDIYTLQARKVIGRVLRNYLGDEGICALELIAAPERLKRLIRYEDLLNQSIQVIGAAQARMFGAKPQDRIAALYAVLGETHAMLAEAAPVIGAVADDLLAGRVTALRDHLDNGMEPARKRMLALCAVGRCLFRASDARDKIDLLLDMAGRAADHAATRDLCDEVIAEILDDQGAMRRMLGRRADLGDASRIVLQVTTGTRARAAGDDPVLARLSLAMGTKNFPQTRLALLAWLDQAIRSTQPLTREGAEADRAAFAGLVSGLETPGGLIGGPGMAEAVLMRARVVLIAPQEEQRAELALTRLMRLMDTPGCQLGYLLDLLAAPASARLAPAIARQMVVVLRDVPDLAILTDLEEAAAESLLVTLRDRVAASSLPDQVRDMVLPLFDRLRQATSAPGAAPADAQEDDPHRVTLDFGQMLFRVGEKADCAYLVLSGRIGLMNVVNGRELPVGAVGPGGVVGDTALNGNAVRTVNARAMLPTVLRRITQDRFDQAIARLAELEPDALAVLDSLRSRLRDLARRGVAV